MYIALILISAGLLMGAGVVLANWWIWEGGQDE